MRPVKCGRRALLVPSLALCLVPVASTAQQQNATPSPAGAWPSRPIRFVVPFAAGGNSDVTARLFAEQVSKRLRQPIVVENRSGATGAIGTEAVVRSKPDGYTLLIGSPGSIVNGPLLMAAPRYDPIADLAPVALLGQVPMAITVRPEIPVRDLGGLVAYSKARPGGVTIGTSGVGGANHLPLELFKAATGANLVHVPYRGGGNTLPDFLAGNVDGVLIELASVLDLHRDGRGRVLGVASPQRSPAAPEVPTFIEQGHVGFVAASFVGLFAPAGTPEEAMRLLQAAIAEAASDPGVLARLAAFGADPPTGPELTTPGVAAFLQGELAKARRAIAIAGLQPE
jgi:tripartite-type tricarboxylate transporter receptor subunit TctC